MRIAQVAPLIERVPPRAYGGTERVVHDLTEELVRQGCRVTLFASGDSQTSAELVPCSSRALRLDPEVKDVLPHYALMLERVRQRAAEFDILHFHIDLLHFPLFREIGGRVLTTLHGRLDLPDLWPFYDEFSEMPLVSISNHQRLPMPPVNWCGTVYHGMPRHSLPFSPHPAGDYLAFLGRISPEKGLDRAIEIARKSGIPLRIAAKIDKADRAYFKQVIRPLLDDPLVHYIGEIGGKEKAAFLGNARAMLFPIAWPEPFGLVLIEAMSCGTPVIAYPHGSVPEIVDDGVTGILVDSIDEAVAAVNHIGAFDRAEVRSVFETRFSVERMTNDYLSIYRSLSSSDDNRKRAAA